MSPDPLRQFARQLHAWSTEELLRQPGPFRSVELFPPLLSETGTVSPPLVFWVNRDSHLAGGVILLPKKDPDAILSSGVEICTALGLDSYYTWGHGEIAAWQINNTPGRIWSEPLAEASLQEAQSFKETLSLLMQHMTNRFFNLQQQPFFSPPYLANLLNNCIETCVPVAAAANDQDKTHNGTVEESSRITIIYVVLQILTLSSQDLLPDRSTPNRLLADLERAFERLPEPIVLALLLKKSFAPLPEAVEIKLHHLFQRLQQLGSALRPLIPEAMSLLLQHWTASSGLQPLPAKINKNRSTLIINPDRHHTEMAINIEVAKPPMTATTALLRLMQSSNRRHPHQYTDLLELQQPVSADEIIGTLSDQTKSPSQELKLTNTRLRGSWPNRHIKLASSTPQWACGLIHLIGLTQGTPHGILNIPADWLWAPYGEQLYTLLTERSTLNRIKPTGDNQILVEFNKPGDGQRLSITSFDSDIRVLEKQESLPTRSDILLALTLSKSVFDLVRSGELQAAKKTIEDLDAVELFLDSSLGRGLWRLLAQSRSRPKQNRLSGELIKVGLPLPGGDVLAALSRLANKQPALDTATIDRELEAWLGSACHAGVTPRFKNSAPSRKKTPTQELSEESADSLMHQGDIPTFPQDYLYSVDEVNRRLFTIPGPLHQVDSFFNTITLASQKGETLQVEGAVTARVLEFISTFKSGDIELPVDEQQVSEILDRYVRDLRSLYQRIRHKTSDHGQPMTSDRADHIWNHLPVPPLSTLDQL